VGDYVNPEEGAVREEQEATPASRGFHVDNDGLWTPKGLDGAVSVFFDGERVWSPLPSRDGRRVVGGRLTAWPTPLLPYLNGEANVVVRRQNSDDEFFSGTVTLGTGQGRVSIVSNDGVPLSLDKGGHLRPQFGRAPQENRVVLAQSLADGLKVLHEQGLTAFLAFGCLLGAVRDGHLIGHDSDGDIAYIARSSHPFDIITESMQLERTFQDLGWKTRRMSGGDFKLMIPMPDGGYVGCDVFTAFFRDGNLYVMPYVREPLKRSDIEPLSSVTLEGVTVPAPAKPEVLLEATYGPGWKVPDPSFAYKPARQTRRQLAGWMRGERRHRAYWDEFYSQRADDVSAEPSPFARWVGERESAPATLVDIGAGTGRDSLWFATQGFDVLGLDYAREAVDYAHRHARKLKVPARFDRMNLYDARRVLISSALLARTQRTDIVYARFLVHSLEDAGRKHLWIVGRNLLRGSKGRFYIETRTEATNHVFGEHFRQFVQADVIADELVDYGFEIEHLEEGHGLAVHKGEDPRVCRIVARMR
jgi:SAM-dependent methyltransferase